MKPRRAILLSAGAALLASWCPTHAASPAPARFSGGISGVVRSAAGVPQMGAVVVLYNRSDRPIQRTL
ncbi:MAG: hypothetical protein RMI94_08745, partial [Bryobacterales bacterium]|nr:hypothetical protein [Bryobacterales bacterium]